MTKTFVFILTFLSTLAAGQTPTEKLLLGEWSCCGLMTLAGSKDITFNKISLDKIAPTCAKPYCERSAFIFEITEGTHKFTSKSTNGCTGGIYASENSGQTWSISADNKYILIQSRTEEKYKIVSLTSTKLIIKKV